MKTHSVTIDNLTEEQEELVRQFVGALHRAGRSSPMTDEEIVKPLIDEIEGNAYEVAA